MTNEQVYPLMKSLKEVYPLLEQEPPYGNDDDAAWDDYYAKSEPTYKSLVESMGVDVLHSKFCGQYQGDAVFVLKRASFYGWLVFGYGSYSGCDALEASRSFEALDRLRTDLYNSIRWFPTKGELLTFLALWLTEPTTDWYMYDDEIKETTRKIVDELSIEA